MVLSGADGVVAVLALALPLVSSSHHEQLELQQPLRAAASWMDPTDPPQLRAQRLVAEMNVTEMINLFHGSCGGYTGNVCPNARLGIPQIKMNDVRPIAHLGYPAYLLLWNCCWLSLTHSVYCCQQGPQGFRGAAGTSTAFPAAITVAASWDPAVARAWGSAMGDEFYRKGANVQLGPGLCLARVPRNGRNFEYVSGEDPLLGYRMGAAVVRGIQSQGVVANAKHWVNNNQETDRHYISENVDERTQFELYYPPFEGAIQAGLGSVMCRCRLSLARDLVRDLAGLLLSHLHALMYVLAGVQLQPDLRGLQAGPGGQLEL
jgi:beta-glucosidase